MKDITVYHNARCSKSRASCQLLRDRGLDFEIREYLKEPLSHDELKDLLAMLGIPAKELIRTGEAVFKEHFKGKTLSEEEWIEAMVKYPKLIERPIVVKGEKAVIGRPTERVIELL